MPISLKTTASILPYIRYSPQANTMTTAGEDGKPREISFLDKSFAVDIEHGVRGWLRVDVGQRDWQPFTIDGVMPPSPGPSYKLGFSVLVSAPKLFGDATAHEMCSSTVAHLSFCERVYNEAEAQFDRGVVPIVKITSAEPISIGKGKSRELHFTIVKYIPRPAAITEALAKLKAAHSGTPKKDASAGNGAGNADDDFDDEDVVAAPKAEPEKPAEAKPKTRGKKPQRCGSSLQLKSVDASRAECP
jgi:hypothetical protein